MNKNGFPGMNKECKKGSEDYADLLDVLEFEVIN